MGRKQWWQMEDEDDDEEIMYKVIVLKALIHCDGCSQKLTRCLRDFDGVEEVIIDREKQSVTVKGNLGDPWKLVDRVRSKYSKNVDLISPKVKRPSQNEEKKKKSPAKKTVKLRVYIHCEGCAKDVKREMQKMEGIVSVHVDKEGSTVCVRGAVEPTRVVEYMKKRLGKHAEILNVNQNYYCERDAEDYNNCMNNLDRVVVIKCPPRYSTHTHCFSHCEIFSDENVDSCSLM